MLESPLDFKRRINKTSRYVRYHINHGKIILHPRGLVRVEESLENLKKVKRGRPKLPVSERLVMVRVFIKREHRKLLKEFIKQLQ